MQVDPARLVELAASSENILTAMADDWAEAQADLATACASLGDAVGTASMTASYDDALAGAGDVIAALTRALGLGVVGLVDAAHDAVRADEDGRLRDHPVGELDPARRFRSRSGARRGALRCLPTSGSCAPTCGPSTTRPRGGRSSAV